VTAVLRSDLITFGPQMAAFEADLARVVEAPQAVACVNGTAALHLALAALDIGPGDVCIVPAITFLSTATAARFCGADVVFADVDPESGLMTPQSFAEALARAGPKAKAVLPVHLGGRACDMAAIAPLARAAGLRIVEDACHALGGRAGGTAIGASTLSDASCFSFHGVKTIACGEGGAVTTGDADLAARIRRLRNHGVTHDPALMTDEALSLDVDGERNPWSYEQLELGFNYRMTELSAALGRSQLAKLPRFVARRAEIAARYDALLVPLAGRLEPVANPPGQDVSLHLYVVRLLGGLQARRAALMRRLASRGIGTQVHYIPMYRQPYFHRRYGDQSLPGAEAYYAAALAIPLFPAMTDADAERVALELTAAVESLG
jgi:UDP-4-amino-4,6-dideoxy-N-acetyl-beta-L-altrosamine transaminase